MSTDSEGRQLDVLLNGVMLKRVRAAIEPAEGGAAYCFFAETFDRTFLQRNNSCAGEVFPPTQKYIRFSKQQIIPQKVHYQRLFQLP